MLSTFLIVCDLFMSRSDCPSILLHSWWKVVYLPWYILCRFHELLVCSLSVVHQIFYTRVDFFMIKKFESSTVIWSTKTNKSKWIVQLLPCWNWKIISHRKILIQWWQSKLICPWLLITFSLYKQSKMIKSVRWRTAIE